MKEKVEKTDVGVIVGRFQCAELHQAHLDLIQGVLNKHSRVLIFLGLSPLKNTKRNPLEFKHRKQLIEEKFPSVEVYYIDDVQDDKLWSKNLDRQIQKWLTTGQTVTLYGSRDSFIEHYFGKFPTCELESTTFVSASEQRKNIINFYPSSKDFRAGMIASTGYRYPTAYQTVDAAIVNSNGEVLLAKKPNEHRLRFVGGFSDPNSNSLEEDVRREVSEETGVEIDNIQYIGSCKVPDWRYDGEQDCIKTALFAVQYIYGRPTANDDIESVHWVKISSLDKKDIETVHHKLIDLFLNWYKNNPKYIQLPIPT